VSRDTGPLMVLNGVFRRCHKCPANCAKPQPPDSASC
jgi:hypothetical protein